MSLSPVSAQYIEAVLIVSIIIKIMQKGDEIDS